MSSYEDVYGMAVSLFETLKNIQWQSPRHWGLESVVDPVAEQLMLKLSQPQTLVANPTLAAPTNIRFFFRNILSSSEDPAQLITFLSFLIIVPIFSTFFVAMLTNVNIVLRGLGLPLSRNPIRASPLAVILFIITTFGNIPLVSFFPDRAGRFQPYLPVQPGHYTGAIAHVLRIVSTYEIVELGAITTLELVQLLRHGRAQAIRLIQPASITAWLLSIAGFALRMWFTRMSSDTATSLIPSGRTDWVWRKVVLRTDVRSQTWNDTADDISLWMFYFVPAYLVSSLLAKYLLTPSQEAHQPLEPIIFKVNATSTKRLVSTGCQTTVSGEEWVTKSSIALEVERVRQIDAAINTAVQTTEIEALTFVKECAGVVGFLKEATARWQEDHTALGSHIDALKVFREIAEHHEADGRAQRELADKLSGTIKRLGSEIKQRTDLYERKLRSSEQEHQKRLDAVLETVKSLEARLAEYTGTDGTKEASESDANLGPREAENHPVSANTPELQENPQASVPVVTNPEAKSSTDPMLPSPPLSPPNADGTSPDGKQEATGHHMRPSANETSNSESCAKTKASTGHPFLHAPESLQAPESSPRADGNDASPVAVSLARMEGCIEQEKTSDSEMDAANGSAGSDNEVMEEIGTDVWSRVQKFKFRGPEICTRPLKEARQHFTVAEIEKIIAMLTNFRDTVANDAQRARISALLKAGFPYSMDFKYKYQQDLITIFQDIAEANKIPTKERIITELPTFAYAFASGIAPNLTGIISHRGKTWKQLVSVYLATYPRIEQAATPEDRPLTRDEELVKFKRILKRYLGDREELWQRVLSAEAKKPYQAWDFNLIARRFLENFGLLEFREFSREGTGTEPYIPLVVEEPALVEETTAKAPTLDDATPNETPAPKVKATSETPGTIEAGPCETSAPTEEAISEPFPVEETLSETPTVVEAGICETSAANEVLLPETPAEMSIPIAATPADTQQIELPLPEVKAIKEPLTEALPVEAPPAPLSSNEPVDSAILPTGAIIPNTITPTEELHVTVPEASTCTTDTLAANPIDTSAEVQSAIPCVEVSPPSPAADTTLASPTTPAKAPADPVSSPISPISHSQTEFTPRSPIPTESDASPSDATPSHPPRPSPPDWRAEAQKDKEVVVVIVPQRIPTGPQRNSRPRKSNNGKKSGRPKGP